MKNLILLLLPALFFACSCESGNNPLEELEPGRRDYVWTEDTLDTGVYPGYPNRISGTSVNDVWLSVDSGENEYGLWHYNGDTWVKQADKNFLIDLALYSVNENFVLAEGLNDKIYRYNGDSWVLEFDMWDEDYGYGINNFYGEEDNIIACGVMMSRTSDQIGPMLYRYNGSNWIKNALGFPGAAIVNVRTYDTKTLLECYNPEEATNRYSICILDGSLLKSIFQSETLIRLNSVENEIFVNNQKIIYKFNGSGFDLWKDLSNTTFKGTIWGRNEIDFLCMANDGIGHYNGTDYQTIYKTNIRLSCGVIFGKDVFIAGEEKEAKKVIIIHGKLKD